MYCRVCELFSYVSQTFIESPLFTKFFAKCWAHEMDICSVNNIGHLFALSLNDFLHHPRCKKIFSAHPEKTLRQAKSVPLPCVS